MTAPSRTARWILSVLFAALLVSALAAAMLIMRSRNLPNGNVSDDRNADRPDAKIVLAPKLLTLAPRLHALGYLFPSVVYVVETSAGPVLIDAGLAADHKKLRQGLLDLGLDPTQVQAVLLTHAHGDHSMGATAIRDESGAKIHAGRRDTDVLRRGGPWEAIFSKFDMPGVETRPVEVDVELDGGETLTFGDTTIQVIGTPGHTPGSICYLLERDGLRALFTGDTIMSLAGGVGTYSAHLPPRYRGSADDYLATLRKLKKLPAPDLLLPGHPPADPAPQTPFITAADWQARLDEGIADLLAVKEHFASDGADFLDGTGKELLPGMYYLGDIASAEGGAGDSDECAVYLLATAAHLLLVDAPGGRELPDWLDGKLAGLGLGSRRLTAVLLTSTDPQAVAGLPDIVERHGCAVVSRESARPVVEAICPADTRVLTEDELPSAGWLDVKTMPLADFHPDALAYIVLWEGKKVMISGRMPIPASIEDYSDLRRAMNGPLRDAKGYRKSLHDLLPVRPDLWLPAVPLHGQNANLYDEKWLNTISFGLEMISRKAQ
jgi:glyoxylase-like metal-dependent hydrolase (beta-lactamase superfamily II)